MHKLYEHIRLGAMILPHCRDGNGETDERNQMVSACAFWTAAVSVGMSTADNDWGDVQEAFPFSLVDVVCPVCNTEIPCESAILDLNDRHSWTREQIADWLEPIEEKWWAEQEEKQQAAQCSTEKIGVGSTWD